MIEKDKAILAEVTDAIAEVKNDSGKSERNFLPERPDEFPTTAMSFCHINAMIMEQTEELFAVTRCAFLPAISEVVQNPGKNCKSPRQFFYHQRGDES